MKSERNNITRIDPISERARYLYIGSRIAPKGAGLTVCRR